MGTGNRPRGAGRPCVDARPSYRTDRRRACAGSARTARAQRVACAYRYPVPAAPARGSADRVSVGTRHPRDQVGFVAAVSQAAVGAGETAHGDRVLGESGFAEHAECGPGDAGPAVCGCLQRFILDPLVDLSLKRRAATDRYW
jgi:hypothetical protein